MNYTDMQNAIKDYTQNDEVTFTSSLDNFIRSAEEKVFTTVQMPAHFKATSATSVSSDNSLAIPGAVEIYDVRVSSNDSDGPWTYLLRKDYDFLKEAYPDLGSGSQGTPKFYAVSSSSMSGANPQTSIEVAPKVSSTPVYFVVDYYSKATTDSLTSADNQTNGTWLSVSFPNTLLHGALAEAYGFMKTDAGMTNYYEQKFQSDLQGLVSVLSGNPVESPASAA